MKKRNGHKLMMIINILWLELTYYVAAAQQLNHYATRIPLLNKLRGQQILIDNKIEREGFFDGDKKICFLNACNKRKSLVQAQTNSGSISYSLFSFAS